MCTEEDRREKLEEQGAAGEAPAEPGESPPELGPWGAEEPIPSGDSPSEPLPHGEEEAETAEPQADIAFYQERIRALEEELAAKSREVEEYIQHLQRLQADFINFRKRVRREQEEMQERVSEELLRRLLPVMDNLERAVAAASQEGVTVESLRSGVVMVQRQLGELLLKEGVTPLACEGQPFDPAKHHAVAVVETEEYEDNTVIDELQKGYFFKGRVLRPALVRVAKKPHEKVIPFKPEEGESNG